MFNVLTVRTAMEFGDQATRARDGYDLTQTVMRRTLEGPVPPPSPAIFDGIKQMNDKLAPKGGEARDMNSRFGGECGTDWEALLAQLRQARESSARYERDLAAKTVEMATLKEIFNQTRRHSIHLQNRVDALTEERQQGNRSPEMEVLQRKVHALTAEVDRLKAQLNHALEPSL